MTTLEKISSTEVESIVRDMSKSLAALLGNNYRQAKMLGIRTGGVMVSELLQRELQLNDDGGELNISFYRDDFSRIGLHPQVGASKIPFSIEGETVVLVDDVIYSGRTIRAAMNEIFDYGRPEKIVLATLVERDGHDLPIRADIIGRQMDLPPTHQVKLREDMSLEISQLEISN